MAAAKNEKIRGYSTKKCYECLTHIPIDATVCNICNAKVGKVNRIGMAEKPVDVKAYVGFIIAAGALVFFIWKFLI